MKVVAFQTSTAETWVSPLAEPPGKVLAQFLRDDLVKAGAECDRVDLHEEFGWAWLVVAQGARFYVLLMQYAGLANRWAVKIEAQRRLPFLRRPKVPAAELEVGRLIQAALRAKADVVEVRWFDNLPDVANYPDGGRLEP